PGMYMFQLFCLSDYSKDQHGYFMFTDFFCYIPSRNPKEVQYLIDWYFNMELTMQYNSSVGGWTGLSNKDGKISENIYKNKFSAHFVVAEIFCMRVKILCSSQIHDVYLHIEPNVSLQTVEDNVLTLECSTLDFYPKHIRLTWFSNGQEVTEGVTFSDVLPNGDWTYQAHTYLTLTPGKQDHISCMVQHASLKEPKIYNYESSKNQTENYIIGGVCALLLGAVFLCGGLIHYKLRRRSFAIKSGRHTVETLAPDYQGN
uniref:Ig-like domain-containing protein n=1 Tax=Oryzias sinensis TaxID=183150 RepID=A0A8C7ZFR0_9TELE